MAAEEYSEDSQGKIFSDLVNFISNEEKEIEKGKRQLQKLGKKWKAMRPNTIRKIGEIAELMKDLNDEMTPIQATLKGAGMVAKAATFIPAAAVIAAGVSVATDIGYGLCSKHKIDELEKLCNIAQRALEEDSETTEELVSLMKRMRTNSEAIRKCVNKLHSATVKGFFDNVASLRPFSKSIKSIENVNEPNDIKKFLSILFDEVASLAQEPKFRAHFLALWAYNPGVVELTVTIPEIILSAGIMCTAYTGAEVAIAGVALGPVMKGLNLLAICADLTDVIKKLSDLNEYPQLSKDLLEIKRKLEREQKQILMAINQI